ncbi:MAG TPA: glycosyltransferase [Phycisphaerae bacterium]|nr:glycosyltransferase [Phycisphaerae bacterium]
MPADALLAVIPFYKNQRQLDTCLAHLSAQTRPITPWIHDNSADNLGFTKAVNLGLREAIRAGHRYVVALNQDLYLDPRAIEGLTDFLDRTPRCAIAGIKQLSSQNPDLIIHAGCTMAYPTGIHISGLASQGIGAISAKMPWVNGAFLAARVEAMIDFGVMDENMFLFGSDSDWCYTARARQWEVWYCAQAQCIHETGTSQNPTIESTNHFHRDMAYWHEKWVGSGLFRRLNAEFGLSSLNFG